MFSAALPKLCSARITATTLLPTSVRQVYVPQRFFLLSGRHVQVTNKPRRAIHVLSRPLSRPSLPNLISHRIWDQTPSAFIQPSTIYPTSASATPGAGSLAGWIQTRGAKRDTYNPSQIVRKRRHGLLARMRSRTGRKMLARRKAKGRTCLSH